MTLPKETKIHIRKAMEADAEMLIELMKEVEDSGFMLEDFC